MQQIVDRGETRILDDARGVDHLRREGAIAQHRRDGVERRVCRRMEIAVERRGFAQREAADLGSADPRLTPEQQAFQNMVLGELRRMVEEERENVH